MQRLRLVAKRRAPSLRGHSPFALAVVRSLCVLPTPMQDGLVQVCLVQVCLLLVCAGVAALVQRSTSPERFYNLNL